MNHNLFHHLCRCMCLDVGFRINLSSSINTLIKLLLLVETEQTDEDQEQVDEYRDEAGGDLDEADPSHELKEEDEFENPTELADNSDESGMIFRNIQIDIKITNVYVF